MARSARILNDKLLHAGRFRLTRTEVEVEEASGEIHRIDHEVYRYLRAAALFLYDPDRGVVLLVRQFRVGAFLADGALDLLEVCAGMLDDDEPEVCARREAMEEAGVAVGELRFAFDIYMSPGGMTERIACFAARYGAEDRIGPGGGVDADERIDLIEMPFADALKAIETGAIRDAKTVALLYWAKAQGVMGAA